MKIEDRLKRKRVYSDIVELTPWDFCDDSLLPGPLILQACNMQMKLFSYYYWNMFNRVEDKRVTYEVPLVNVHIEDKRIDFMDERRLLFECEANTIFDGTMLQVETNVYKPAYPFERVASCSWHGAECKHNGEEDWVLGEFESVPGITPELSRLLPEAGRPAVENINTALNRISASGEWQGPAETRHKIMHPYCEYGFMGGFMNYTAPMLSAGRDAMLGYLELNSPGGYKGRLAGKLDYRGWNMWLSIKKALFFNDEVIVNSYYLSSNDREYIKHEIYSARPRILRNIILEQY